MAIQAARPVRPAGPARPANRSAAPAIAAAPAHAPRPRGVIKAREGLENLKRWIMVRAAMVGAGFGLFFAGIAAFGHPLSTLLMVGLAAGTLAGAGVGAFIGGQLADLAIYTSGRIQLKRTLHQAND